MASINFNLSEPPRVTESEPTDPLEGPFQSLASRSEDVVATTCSNPGVYT